MENINIRDLTQINNARSLERCYAAAYILVHSQHTNHISA
jgi:hypothetical protein